MRFSSSLFLCLGLALGFAGCNSSDVALKCVISGGETKIFELGRGGPVSGEDSHMKIDAAGGLVEPQSKKFYFAFCFEPKKNAVPTKVVVEDVTDETAVTLFTDEAPKLDEKHLWRGTTPTYDIEHSSVAWINHEGNTVRVYKFTVTFADGSRSELFQPSMIPYFGKMVLKAQMGLKTTP